MENFCPFRSGRKKVPCESSCALHLVDARDNSKNCALATIAIELGQKGNAETQNSDSDKNNHGAKLHVY